MLRLFKVLLRLGLTDPPFANRESFLGMCGLFNLTGDGILIESRSDGAIALMGSLCGSRSLSSMRLSSDLSLWPVISWLFGTLIVKETKYLLACFLSFSKRLDELFCCCKKMTLTLSFYSVTRSTVILFYNLFFSFFFIIIILYLVVKKIKK